jgi:hypothetical protein
MSLKQGSIKVKHKIAFDMIITNIAKTLHNAHSKRASVLPYTLINGELWVLLAIHYQSGEITDLGGGVKRSESDIEAAFREFTEETNGIFLTEINCVKDLESCICVSRKREEKVLKPFGTKVYVEGLSTIFLPIDSYHFATTADKFNKSERNEYCNEIQELVWVKGNDVLQPTSSMYKMWSFVRKFYYEAFTLELRHKLGEVWIQRMQR